MKNEVFNIFYTDDDKDDQDLFKDAAHEVLKTLQIITQENGDELIHSLKNPPPFPNLIFLDLNMPVKNGYEVLKEIRQSPHIKDLPVIIFSTSDDAKAISTTRDLGANLYIQKPASFNLLKKAIAYTLSINWETFSPSDKHFFYQVN
jgi:CheY-like chemotaxis protein